MIFETDRLILRPWKEEDAVSLYQYASSSEVGPVAGWPAHKNVEESLEIIRNVLSQNETYAICLKDNVAIGSIGLMSPNTSHTYIDENELEIGYWIGVDFWGNGYVSEAVKCLEEYAFMILGVKGIWAGYYEGNHKSRRVMEKCGFIYHHSEEDKVCTLMHDIRNEHYMYISQKQWHKNRER